MLKPNPIVNEHQFMGAWYFSDISICDKLIDYHKNSDEKRPGIIGSGKVVKEVKDSTDLSILDDKLLSEYGIALTQVVDEYKLLYPWCNMYGKWGVLKHPQVKHYKPTAAYHGWHTERTNADPSNSTRHLVFMTYLNTLTDSGETEWLHQNIKVKPEKGLTVIWPADWTFTHRGVPSPSQEKYIVTGWFNYY